MAPSRNPTLSLHSTGRLMLQIDYSNRLFLLLQLVLLLSSQTVTAAEPLFNGRDLTGWYSFLVDTQYQDPRKVFTVTNGTIRISGDGLGYLATHRRFTNYHLVLEYRWGKQNYPWGDRIGKARDSGVFLHATGPDGNSEDGQGAFMAAIECNVFQGATGDFLLIRGKDAEGKAIWPRLTTTVAPGEDHDGWFTYAPGGEVRTLERWGRINWSAKDSKWRDELDFRGENDLETSGWNTLECIALHDTLEVKLNGTTINRATQVWPSSGKILLQCEGSEIFFRKIILKPLEQVDLSSEE